MKPLDTGQQREAEFLRSQRSSWVNQGLGRRLTWACVVGLGFGGVTGGVVAIAGGPWLLLGLAFALILLLPLDVHALAPERALEWSVRANVPSQESMERGDRNRSWPG